jgi:hypothetical protein
MHAAEKFQDLVRQADCEHEIDLPTRRGEDLGQVRGALEPRVVNREALVRRLIRRPQREREKEQQHEAKAGHGKNYELRIMN